jgi:response regulator RpfG family c-di-GMP phosphodiesterase
MLPKILLVDDEEFVLSGYKRNLRNQFIVYTANSGELGLKILKEKGPFSVVISDFKMPEMNGNIFLSRVKELSPDTVRIMLTGYADLSTTIDAVNEGNIFRLLTKPCTIEKLVSSINDGVKQYNLVTTEHVLLEKTFKGSIKLLTEILSTVNPIAFSRASRFQKFIPQISNLLHLENKWELEIASLLSQIGLVILPPEISEKKYSDEPLTEEQEKLFNTHPAVGKSLLENIPRLEKIAEAIYYQLYPYKEDKKTNDKTGNSLPIISRILKVLNDFDTYVTAGNSLEDAFKKLKLNGNNYDPDVLVALDVTISGIYEGLTLETIEIEDVQPGVIVASDIKNKSGTVLVTKGMEITGMLKSKLLNYVKLCNIDSKIKILR